MHARPPRTSRRDFFAHAGTGVLGAALTHLFCQDFFGGTASLAAAADAPGAYNLKPKRPHHPATATSVIHLFMNGGPSQVDLFDPKPVLNRMDGRR